MLQIDSVVDTISTGIKFKPTKTLVVINIDKYDVPISMIKISSLEEFIKVFGDSDRLITSKVQEIFMSHYCNQLDVYCAKSGIPINSDGYDFVCVF